MSPNSIMPLLVVLFSAGLVLTLITWYFSHDKSASNDRYYYEDEENLNDPQQV